MHLLAEIIVSGFAISALYALGAAGFTLIFGVSGVLNLAHGAHMVIAAIVTWLVMSELQLGIYQSAVIGIIAAVASTWLLYFAVVRPITVSRRIPASEKEIFILTATLLVGIIAQGVLDAVFGSNPITTVPLARGVSHLFGVTIPVNELVIGGVAWVVLALLAAFIRFTRIGKSLLAAAMSARGLALVGVGMWRVTLIVWTLYGLLAGISGVMLASFFGASPDAIPDLTALAFTIVVLGGLGNVLGSLGASYIIGFVGTVTAYLISPSITELPALCLLIVVLIVRPQGLFGRH